MNETAALLVDYVIPRVPVRHIVLTLPFELRYRIAYDKKLISDVLTVFVRAVSSWYRRRALPPGYHYGRTGSVTSIQRSSTNLNLNPHYHVLFLDGVYGSPNDMDPPTFFPAPRPDDEEIKRLTEKVATRIIALLVRRGLLDEGSAAPDPLSEEEPLLAGILAAGTQGTTATGDRAGKRIRRVLSDPATGQRTGNLCFCSRGFSLHAGRQVKAQHRTKLEELARYILRPPFANNRLSWLSENEVLFHMKRRFDDGTSHLIFSPSELLERLVALIPTPRANILRFHGVLAPRAKWRRFIVPTPLQDPATEMAKERLWPPKVKRRYRIPWAELYRRVFKEDIEQCPCGGRFQIIAYVTDPDSVRRYLCGTGLPAEEPFIAPARPPPQRELCFE
jgi:hypothetical protein